MLVIDASVAVKWVIRDPRVESRADKAVAILRAIRENRERAVQPPHWLAETLAVIARSRPQRVNLMLGLLHSLPFDVEASAATYRCACEIAIDHGQHLFDTLYHAVAIERGATLVTADERYFKKTRGIGSIELLMRLAI